jgi:hypothetical protein
MNRATAVEWEEVQFGWDSAYLFSHDPDTGRFTARRRDDLAEFTAESPYELQDLISADYRTRKVPREAAP